MDDQSQNDADQSLHHKKIIGEYTEKKKDTEKMPKSVGLFL